MHYLDETCQQKRPLSIPHSFFFAMTPGRRHPIFRQEVKEGDTSRPQGRIPLFFSSLQRALVSSSPRLAFARPWGSGFGTRGDSSISAAWVGPLHQVAPFALSPSLPVVRTLSDPRPGDDAAMFTTLTDPAVMALKQVGATWGGRSTEHGARRSGGLEEVWVRVG